MLTTSSMYTWKRNYKQKILDYLCFHVVYSVGRRYVHGDRNNKIKCIKNIIILDVLSTTLEMNGD